MYVPYEDLSHINQCISNSLSLLHYIQYISMTSNHGKLQ